MMKQLMDSWYTLLSGNVSYNSAVVPVYKEDAPSSETGNYILLRAEGSTDSSNNHRFEKNLVVVVDIVTVYQVNVTRSAVDEIAESIFDLVLPSPNATALPYQAGIQILNVTEDSSTYLYEDDDIKKYYRKVIRYSHHIIKTS